MANPTAKPAPAAPPFPRRLLLWAIFLSLLALAAAFKLWQNDRHDSAVAAWDRLEPKRDFARNAIASDLRQHIGDTPQQIQEYFHLRRPLEAPSPDGTLRANYYGGCAGATRIEPSDTRELSWFDPELDAEFRLSFRTGKLERVIGVAVTHDGGAYIPSKLWRIGNTAREELSYWVPFPWLAMMILTLLFPRARRPMAEVALALALLQVVLHLLPARGWPTWSQVTAGRQGVYDLVMLVTSAGLLALLHWPKRTPVTDPLCPCGYNLTGNISGICPECGTPIARSMIRKLMMPVLPPPILPAELMEEGAEDLEK